TLLPKTNELIGPRVFACGAYRNEYVWAVLASTLVIVQHPETPVIGVPPPIYIKSLSVNGTAIPTEGPHEFSHDQNSAAIEYVGLSFKNERAVRYQYRMFGADSEWTAPSKQQSVTFASLRPGYYTFEVRAINTDGITSTIPASIRFVIVPPVWMRWWFVVLVVLVAALILILIYRYRVARLLEIERLRTRIAADLHDDVGTNLSSIMLATEIIERQLPRESLERNRLAELRSRAGTTQEMLKDIVWLLNPRNDTVGDFILKLKEIARRQLMGIPCTFTASGEQRVGGLSLEFKRNVVLFLKEAVTNIVKHADATAVTIDLVFGEDTFSLSICDNGKGFPTEDESYLVGGNGNDASTRGDGLTNLRARAGHIGGSAEITSAPGQGTTIRLISKIP
ncbi:MAG: ATP-binding protein, partial [Ignavibacteriae bacterium]|nr:ATP-binding protein [Ignavibacteriota bacterium]